MITATAMPNLPDVPLWTDRGRHLHALQALSIDAGLLRSLREPRFRGWVHSVFERVVNVESEDGELFTIASRDLDNAPRSLIVDTPGFGALGIERGDRVDVTGSAIAIDMRLGIRLDRATPWHPSLPPYPAADSSLRTNLATIRQQLGHRAIGGPASPGGAVSALACSTSAMLERHAALLCDAFVRRDLEAACAHGHALIGLGPGLTPSGDDFLVGLFAVLHLPGSPCRDESGACVAIVTGMERRTHAISVAALTAAARGQVRESIQSLLRELMSGSPAGLGAQLSAVLAIGSTSGGDIVAGIVAGFEIHLQAAGRR